MSGTTFKGALDDLICGGSLLAHLQVENWVGESAGLGPFDMVEHSGHVALGENLCMDRGRGAANRGYEGEVTSLQLGYAKFSDDPAQAAVLVFNNVVEVVAG